VDFQRGEPTEEAAPTESTSKTGAALRGGISAAKDILYDIRQLPKRLSELPGRLTDPETYLHPLKSLGVPKEEVLNLLMGKYEPPPTDVREHEPEEVLAEAEHPTAFGAGEAALGAAPILFGAAAKGLGFREALRKWQEARGIQTGRRFLTQNNQPLTNKRVLRPESVLEAKAQGAIQPLTTQPEAAAQLREARSTAGEQYGMVVGGLEGAGF